MAQQDAFEEAAFLHSFKTVDEMLEFEFLYAHREVDAILEHQKEPGTAYLAQEDSVKRWLEVQFTEDLNEADLRLGMRPGMALLWSVKDESPSEAAGTIVVLEGWCLRHLTFIQEQLSTHPRALKWVAQLHEIFRLLHIDRLANNAIFNTWGRAQLEADEANFLAGEKKSGHSPPVSMEG